MQVQVKYTFGVYSRQYVVNPIGTGLYPDLESYQAEMVRYFPGAIVTEFVEPIEFELEVPN